MVLGSKSVTIASCDPLLHAPTVTALPRRVLLLMLPGMVSDPCCPVRGYRRCVGAATVQPQDIPFWMPDVTVSCCGNLGHSHLRHSREARERLPSDHIPVPHATEFDCLGPASERSDLHRTRGGHEQPPRSPPDAVVFGYSWSWHLHL